MTKETAERVAKHNTIEDVQKWTSAVARCGADAQPAFSAVAAYACFKCPFRKNGAMGGCLGDECPVNAAKKAVNLIAKRVAASAKEIYKAKYAKHLA